jgi:catechol 2,3-dioxygenase-like lactoylglutathione lyase family enzyme
MDDLEALLRTNELGWTENELRSFACQCCRRVSLLCQYSIFDRLLDANAHSDELRAESVQLYDSLYPGHGSPSAEALAHSAAGEAAFTKSAVDAAINASSMAAMAMATEAAEPVTVEKYDDAYDAAYRTEREAQMGLLTMCGNETTENVHLSHSHLRIARPTDNLESVVAFYRDGLGMDVLTSFQDHDGFNGVMLGAKGGAWHLEFTRKAGYRAGKAPTEDNLLVFYLPDAAQWRAAVQRLERAGYHSVPSFNPYFDQRGKTFADPDGYRVVLQNGKWE